MNLEDFKSFRRALKPSEVGSIPTHSRHAGRVAALVVALAPLLAAGGSRAADEAAADDPPPAPVPVAAFALEPPGGPSPFQRAVRSAAVPAWGQLTNGKRTKAAILFGVQTWIYTRIVIESRQAREDRQRAAALERVGADAADVALAEDQAQGHYDSRRDLVFWAILAGFYGAMDAYVDANLGDFERELEDGRALFGRVDPQAGSVELGLKF